jgi:hypothetical protein
MSEQLAVTTPRPLIKASDELSSFLGMERSAMIDTIKAQCFKGKRPEEVTDAQLATYISVANALKLNPLLPGQMYPYPDRNGSVTVMIGPDGVFTLLSNHPDVVAQKDGGPAFWTEYHAAPEQVNDTCTGYINHRTKGLLKKTIWVNEWIVSSNPNWATRRHHMAEIRALKQVGRMVIHGLPMDSDEHKLGEMVNVTDTVTEQATAPAEPQVQRAAAPARAKKGAATVPDTKPAAIEAEIVPDAPKVEPAKVEPKVVEPVKPAPVAETPAAEPAPTNTPTARAFLKDGEAVQVKCTVKEVTTLMVNFKGTPTPSVSLTLGGEYIGPALHIGGASGAPDKLTPNVPWAPGATVLVSLRGKANPASGGKVLVRVDEVKAIEASPANPAMDVE